MTGSVSSIIREVLDVKHIDLRRTKEDNADKEVERDEAKYRSRGDKKQSGQTSGCTHKELKILRIAGQISTRLEPYGSSIPPDRPPCTHIVLDFGHQFFKVFPSRRYPVLGWSFVVEPFHC